MADIVLVDSLPITLNYAPKADMYWWVTFINVINQDLLEAYVTVNSPVDNQFPCQQFIDHVNSPKNRASISKNKGVLGTYPVAGENPFNQGNPGPITNPDLSQVIQGLNIVNPVGLRFIQNGNFDLTNPNDLATCLQDLENLNIITPQGSANISVAIALAIQNNKSAQATFEAQTEQDPLTVGIATQQLLKNFNDVFNSNFFIDNKGGLIGLGGPAGLMFNNPGLPLQLFRIVDYIEISNLDNHNDLFTGTAHIDGQRHGGGVDFADGVFNIVLAPFGQLVANP